ncbi:hypothetical protein AKO1_004231 [Acrasis kona]|uniref:RING-type E3 ubiquitin transferase n=1 Tax=Acrasis kona TaxID=1008807 RepID=A0AAW2Z726_9EUKA
MSDSSYDSEEWDSDSDHSDFLEVDVQSILGNMDLDEFLRFVTSLGGLVRARRRKINANCKFFMMGHCREGQNCRFIHDEDQIAQIHPAATDPEHHPEIQRRSNSVCKFFLKGSCLKGDFCNFLHENVTTEERGITCSICMDGVIEQSKEFGLLSECDHAFCLPCIREWRRSQTDLSKTRTCPLCRKTSNYVIPSHHFPSTAIQKDEIVDAYKSELKTKPCKYYQRLQECPFGQNCFYSHSFEEPLLNN